MQIDLAGHRGGERLVDKCGATGKRNTEATYLDALMCSCIPDQVASDLDPAIHNSKVRMYHDA